MSWWPWPERLLKGFPLSSRIGPLSTEAGVEDQFKPSGETCIMMRASPKAWRCDQARYTRPVSSTVRAGNAEVRNDAAVVPWSNGHPVEAGEIVLQSAGKATAGIALLKELPPSVDLAIINASDCELVANLRHAT